MRQNKNAQDIYKTIEVKLLKAIYERLVQIATVRRRSITAQAAICIEYGINTYDPKDFELMK